MQNIHGKEIDLLRTTVKVPGKRLPRATPATAPGTSPRANGLALERSSAQLGGGTGEGAAEVGAGRVAAVASSVWESGARRDGPRKGGVWGRTPPQPGPQGSKHAGHPVSCSGISSAERSRQNAALVGLVEVAASGPPGRSEWGQIASC